MPWPWTPSLRQPCNALLRCVRLHCQKGPRCLHVFMVLVGLQSHPVRVCKVPQRPGLHLSAPSKSPLDPVCLLAVQPLHVDLWQTGCTASVKARQVCRQLSQVKCLTAANQQAYLSCWPIASHMQEQTLVLFAPNSSCANVPASCPSTAQ